MELHQAFDLHRRFAAEIRRRVWVDRALRAVAVTLIAAAVVSAAGMYLTYRMQGRLLPAVWVPTTAIVATIIAGLWAFKHTPSHREALRIADRFMDGRYLLPTAWHMLNAPPSGTPDPSMQGLQEVVLASSSALIARSQPERIAPYGLPPQAYLLPVAGLLFLVATVLIPRIAVPHGTTFAFGPVASVDGSLVPAPVGPGSPDGRAADAVDDLPDGGGNAVKPPASEGASAAQPNPTAPAPMDDTLRGLAPGTVLNPGTVPSAGTGDSGPRGLLRSAPATPGGDRRPTMEIPFDRPGDGPHDPGRSRDADRSRGSDGSDPEQGDADEGIAPQRMGDPPSQVPDTGNRGEPSGMTPGGPADRDANGERMDGSTGGGDSREPGSTQRDDGPADGLGDPSPGDGSQRGEQPGIAGGTAPGEGSAPPAGPAEELQRRAATINRLALPRTADPDGPTTELFTRMAPEPGEIPSGPSTVGGPFSGSTQRSVDRIEIPEESRQYVRDYFYLLSRQE